MHVRPATAADLGFVLEMVRQACVIEERPLPDLDSPEVASLRPAEPADAVIAEEAETGLVGAAWWCWHDPPLPLEGAAVPEMALAVVPGRRGEGIGTALIEALADVAATRFDRIALNVHLRNPAARLYTRTGFRVAGRGRGWYGVAMVRWLRGSPPD